MQINKWLQSITNDTTHLKSQQDISNFVSHDRTNHNHKLIYCHKRLDRSRTGRRRRKRVAVRSNEFDCLAKHRKNSANIYSFLLLLSSRNIRKTSLRLSNSPRAYRAASDKGISSLISIHNAHTQGRNTDNPPSNHRVSNSAKTTKMCERIAKHSLPLANNTAKP